MSTISRRGNRIKVLGDLHRSNFFLANLHHAVELKGYNDIVLDMEECTSAFPDSMLQICSQITAYRQAGIEVTLIPPKGDKLNRLIKNTNWAYLIDPRRFDPSTYKGASRIPATGYASPREQQKVVNQIIDVVLGSLPDPSRHDIAAFEWCLNEITDNVLVHSNSPIGGLIQVSTFKKQKKGRAICRR